MKSNHHFGPTPIEDTTALFDLDLLAARSDVANRIVRRRKRRRARIGAAVFLLFCSVGLVIISRQRTPDRGTYASRIEARSPVGATTEPLPASTETSDAQQTSTSGQQTVDTPVAAVQPQYSSMNYSKDSQGNGQLTFHFTNPIDAKPVVAVSDMSSAPHGQISYTQQDPHNGVRMICGNRHFGLTDSTIDLLLPAEWFPTEVRADPHLSLSEGVNESIADGVFGKVVGCPASDGLLQVSIVLANNPTPDRVRVDAVQDIITVTVKM